MRLLLILLVLLQMGFTPPEKAVWVEPKNSMILEVRNWSMGQNEMFEHKIVDNLAYLVPFGLSGGRALLQLTY